MKRHEDKVAALLRRAFCALFCGCGRDDDDHDHRPRVLKTWKLPGKISITFEGNAMFSVGDDSPPLQCVIEVDDKKGFKTTDTDTPTFASSDDTVASIDSNGVVTVGAPGTCQLTATFGDPAAGGFVISEDQFTVIPGVAVGGKMTFAPTGAPQKK